MTSEFSHALDQAPALSSEASDSAHDLTELIAENQSRAQEAENEIWGPSTMNSLDHFGFTVHPFADSVNPDFFYGSAIHETALKKMMMTIQDHISLGLVHGASGTGKTLLTQMLLTHLNPKEYQVALVMVSPGMSKTSLLKEILRELMEDCDSLPAHTQALLDLLHSQIISLYGENRKLVILIDEAHFLSAESLHILRTISNLETPQKKLATILLFAEDLFIRRLSHPSYQSLRNRMYMKVSLAPMALDETVQYIKFRHLSAGRTESVFEDETYDDIHKASGGICRDINRICHNSLTEAFLKKRTRIGRETVRDALS